MGPGLSLPYAVPSLVDGGSGFMDPGEKVFVLLDSEVV